jgi:hypothetical protein
MKRLISLFVIVSFFTGVFAANPYLGSEDNTGPKLFYFGPGLFIGGFYPSDINDYLANYYTNVAEVSGTTEMMLYFGFNVTGSFFFTKFTELQLESEFAFSPKLVSISGGSTDYFTFRRVTPNLKFNFHIPLGRKVSYFIGVGGSYSFLNFKDPEESYSGQTPGGSIQTGVFLRFGKIGIQPGLTFNFIDGKVDDNKGYDLEKLNYTGVHIGCKVLF